MTFTKKLIEDIKEANASVFVEQGPTITGNINIEASAFTGDHLDVLCLDPFKESDRDMLEQMFGASTHNRVYLEAASIFLVVKLEEALKSTDPESLTSLTQ